MHKCLPGTTPIWTLPTCHVFVTSRGRKMCQRDLRGIRDDVFTSIVLLDCRLHIGSSQAPSRRSQEQQALKCVVAARKGRFCHSRPAMPEQLGRQTKLPIVLRTMPCQSRQKPFVLYVWSRAAHLLASVGHPDDATCQHHAHWGTLQIVTFLQLMYGQ